MEMTPSMSAPAGAHASTPEERKSIAAWLLLCCSLVFAMVVVGGITRLTHSGLSITEWQPIVGTLPPLSIADWNEAFAKYQRTPEYSQVNPGMTLGAFKRIFWWEYFHRLLGRAIGFVFLLPLVWFVVRKRIPPRLAPQLAAIFVLGGAQGALGWYMVQSGLIDDPRVSQFRLTAHLGLAFLIFAAMLWVALSLLRGAADVKPIAPNPLRGFACAIVALVFLMVLSGGLVAGVHAGFAYNTFPLMHGHVVPPELMVLEPWYRNFFYNMATVQFDHRLIAWVLAIVIGVFWWRVRIDASLSRVVKHAADLMLGTLIVQLALGITTLLLVVPLPIAAAHQAGALLLFATALNVGHRLR